MVLEMVSLSADDVLAGKCMDDRKFAGTNSSMSLFAGLVVLAGFYCSSKKYKRK